MGAASPLHPSPLLKHSRPLPANLQFKHGCIDGDSPMTIEAGLDLRKHIFADCHLEWVIVASTLQAERTSILPRADYGVTSHTFGHFSTYFPPPSSQCFCFGT